MSSQADWAKLKFHKDKAYSGGPEMYKRYVCFSVFKKGSLTSKHYLLESLHVF